MFEVKDNKEIGAYIEKLIVDKFPNKRQFSIAYIEKVGLDRNNQEQIRKTSNKINQIIKGERATIQIRDLPIFCELLGVSCEQILSCGECYRPIKNHITNYEVAFSKNRKKWEDYMKREDKLFLNYDEYGKSVVDYALEFKNYDFIKYLISGGHLNFVDNSKWNWGITFGLSTDIKRREIGHTDIWPIPAPHVPENIFYEERLRTRVLALATEQRDFRMMDELKARMNPAIYALNIYNNHNTHIRDQRNKDFIETIAESQDDIIDYYSSEYEAEDRFGRKHTFIYPYISDVIKIMIANNNKSVSAVIEKCIRHNEQVYKLLSDNMNTYMQMRLEEYSHRYGFETPEMKQCNISLAKIYTQHGFNYNSEDKIVSFYYSPQRKEYEGMVSNIVIADCKSDNENINKLIQQLNDWADKIIELGKND